MKLEKGAPVRVRLHTGEVVEAEYDEPAALGKHHLVEHNGRSLQTVGFSHRLTRHSVCRFVGPACDLVPVGVSV